MKALTIDKTSSKADGNTGLFNASCSKNGQSYGGRSTLDNGNGEDTCVRGFLPERRV